MVRGKLPFRSLVDAERESKLQRTAGWGGGWLAVVGELHPLLQGFQSLGLGDFSTE